jgi:hypothetical protein
MRTSLTVMMLMSLQQYLRLQGKTYASLTVSIHYQVGSPIVQDAIVEYRDEFGRTRTAPRSEIPRHLLPGSAGGSSAELEEDPMVEYEDEFGRVRTARRSEIPRELLGPAEAAPEDESVIRTPNHAIYGFKLTSLYRQPPAPLPSVRALILPPRANSERV